MQVLGCCFLIDLDIHIQVQTGTFLIKHYSKDTHTNIYILVSYSYLHMSSVLLNLAWTLNFPFDGYTSYLHMSSALLNLAWTLNFPFEGHTSLFVCCFFKIGGQSHCHLFLLILEVYLYIYFNIYILHTYIFFNYIYIYFVWGGEEAAQAPVLPGNHSESLFPCEKEALLVLQ